MCSCDDLVARGVVAVGIGVVHADVVGREGEVVVRVGLAIGHEDRVPRQAQVAGLEVAQQQFVLLLVVVGRLRPGPAVLGPIGGAEAVVVRLHAVVALAVDARRPGLNARQQAARRIARLHVGIDLLDELVMGRVLDLDAVERLAVGLVRLAADVVRHARLRHQIAFVGRVDEHLAARSVSPVSIVIETMRVPSFLTPFFRSSRWPRTTGDLVFARAGP